jgi:tRNA (cmo5U34)-methyltransferase
MEFSFAKREEGFDNHIRQSIRGYDDLIDDVVSMSKYFVEDDTNVIDIGSSTGNLIQKLFYANKNITAQFFGYEMERNFLREVDERRFELIKNDIKNVSFMFCDAREKSYTNSSFVTSIFTLQFMSKKDRQYVIDKVYQGLNKGGAFVFAEKTLCEHGLTQDILTFNHYDFKRKSFGCEDIMNKEQELRNMMKPNTWGEIETMLYNANFEIVQPFWRNHAFVGAMAIK